MRFIGNGVATILANGNNTTMLDITNAGFQMQDVGVNVSDANELAADFRREQTIEPVH